MAEVGNSVEVAAGGGVFVELGGVVVQAAGVGGSHRVRPGRRGRRGLPRRSRSLRGKLALAGGAGRADRGNPRAGTAARPRPGLRPAAHRCPGAGPGRGSGRARADAGERPADAFARDGRVGQGLLQPVLAQGVPFGVGQVPGRGCFQEGLRQRRSPCPGGGHPSPRWISAAAAGGAFRYRASSSGAPARNWMTCPSCAPRRPGPAARPLPR